MQKRDTALVVAVVGMAGLGGYLMYTGPGLPRIDLGSLADWLAAVGAGSAAIVALWIATQDRAERQSERIDEQETHARFLRLQAKGDSQSRVSVKVRNFGAPACTGC